MIHTDHPFGGWRERAGRRILDRAMTNALPGLRVAVLGAALLAVSFAGGFGRANAGEPGTAPVQVVRCTVNQRRGYVDPYKSVSIDFVNLRDAPADEVRFTVRYAGRTSHILDRGTFSKAVRIDHIFHEFWGALFVGSNAMSCTVDYVHFADDSAWSALS
jgi:hypothetical protein